MAVYKENEIPEFYLRYMGFVDENSIVEQMQDSANEYQELTDSIPDEKKDFSYDEGKWTVRQLLGHMADTERIMQYRAMRFARNDKTDLPGFEENDYAQINDVSGRSIKSLATEFLNLRQSTIDLFESFSADIYERHGTANGLPMTVNALACIIVGHQRHHQHILKERYLSR